MPSNSCASESSTEHEQVSRSTGHPTSEKSDHDHRKLQLAFLFSVGFTILIVTAIRIPFTVDARSSETVRISWTTGEFLAATFVANAPKLYSFRHLMERRNGPIRRFSIVQRGGGGDQANGGSGGGSSGKSRRSGLADLDLADPEWDVAVTEVASTPGSGQEADGTPKVLGIRKESIGGGIFGPRNVSVREERNGEKS